MPGLRHRQSRDSGLAKTAGIPEFGIPRLQSLTGTRTVPDSYSRLCERSLMEFGRLQYTGKVGDKVRGHKSWKSATWFVSWTFMIRKVGVRYWDLCLMTPSSFGSMPGLYSERSWWCFYSCFTCLDV